MARLRLPWARGRRIAPSEPHRFQEPNDPGLGSIASGGFGPGSRPSLNNVLLTQAYARDRAAMADAHCDLAGCGKPRHHPVHNAGA